MFIYYISSEVAMSNLSHKIPSDDRKVLFWLFNMSFYIDFFKRILIYSYFYSCLPTGREVIIKQVWIVKEALSNILYNALKEAKEKAELKIEEEPLVVLEITKDQTKGDIATTVAMALAASEKKKPRDIAEIIIRHLRDDKGIIDKTEIAGPGFINFFLKDEYYHKLLKQIDKEGKNYGRVDIGKGEKVQVEFVSANPTGPLHVGHGRGAAVGDALSNLLAAVGFNVTREFYINDAGRQVRLLAQSVYSMFKKEPIPEGGFQWGD